MAINVAAMHLLRGLHNPGLGESGVTNTKCVATIGNFDGVHIGHQAIIQQVITEAKKRQLPALIIIFEPQPMEFFKGEEAPARLMRFREKFQALADYDLDYVFCLKFDVHLSQLSAEEFVQRVLVSHLNIDHLVIGDDFRFGGDRQGDFTLLSQLSERFGFTVENTHTVLAKESCDGLAEDCAIGQDELLQRSSSTFVRELLSAGEFVKVELLLGRPYSFCGRVAHGQKLGRQLGFPTANIHLKRVSSPLMGVFAVSMFMHASGRVIEGVANVGCKPTVGQFKPSLEVHLFDFDENIYGQFVEVRFHSRLREEKVFEGIDQLKAQIEQDSEHARAYFARVSSK